jgi:hypothetical protein
MISNEPVNLAYSWITENSAFNLLRYTSVNVKPFQSHALISLTDNFQNKRMRGLLNEILRAQFAEFRGLNMLKCGFRSR